MFRLDHLPNPIPDEQVKFFLRRHPATLFGLAMGYLLLIATPLALYFYLANFQPEILQNGTVVLFMVMGGSVFFLFAWLFLFMSFMDYVLDMWIVTDRRILSVEQTGLFSRTVSELRLYRIQDVTATVNGIWNTMFNFGDVEIQTAAEKEHFLFEQVPNPNIVSKGILEMAEVDRQGHLETAMDEFAAAEKERAVGKVTEP